MTEKEEGVREIERERQIERHRWRDIPRQEDNTHTALVSLHPLPPRIRHPDTMAPLPFTSPPQSHPMTSSKSFLISD